jgi:hypothetical protein
LPSTFSKVFERPDRVISGTLPPTSWLDDVFGSLDGSLPPTLLRLDDELFGGSDWVISETLVF